MPAATKSQVQRKRELGAIHIAKKQLGLSDDDYRDILEDWTGKRSAGKMNSIERQRVIDNFRKMGFERKGQKLSIATDDKPQVKKIKMQWLALHRAGAVENPSIQALNAYVKRMTQADNVVWLTPAKANTVIEALKMWIARVEAHEVAP